MKASTPQLRALLATGKFVRADAWTITLNGGQVLRYTNADIPLAANGQTFARGPLIKRSAVSEKIGFEVATLTMGIDAGDADTVNSVPLIQFVANRGLDGANIKLEQAFAPDWASPVTGAIVRFAGRVTSIGEIKGTHAEVTVSAWTVLLNVNMPPDLYQVGCLRTLYDSQCAVNPEAFAAAGTVSAGGSVIAFGSNITGHAGFYNQGRMVFLTGANAGLTRSIKSNDGSGNFALINPLPIAPAAGDTFKAYAGCDLTQSTCGTKFNNLGRFKATPYVPIPETVT